MRSLNLVLILGLAAASSSVFAQGEQQRRNPLAELDTDGDGSISFAEFQEGDNQRFSDADADGDGLISLEELLAARPERESQGQQVSEDRLAKRQARMEERITAQFQEMDADGDGLVSPLERQEYGFLRLDRDNNGLISAEEMQPRRRGGPGFAQRQGRRDDMRRGESDND